MSKFLWNSLVWLFRSIAAFVVYGILVIVLFRIVPPAITPLMVQRLVTAPVAGNRFFVQHHWVSYDNVSSDVLRAIVAGEDAGFMRHGGVDWKAVDNAKRANPARIKRGRLPLGASTITMQTSKNVFLLPFRTIVRKVFEVSISYAIEFIWGKRRILEVYVNMIEWGDGLYGIESAAKHYYSKSARDLSRTESVALAAIVPNPRRFSPYSTTGYVGRKKAFISNRLSSVAIPR